MRWLVNYIRSCFCKHEWVLLNETRVHNNAGMIIGTRWTHRCKNCGYTKTYKDY